MEELVNKLANLQITRKEFEDRADNAVRQMGYDRNIHDLEMELKQQIELRDSIRRPFENEMSKIDEGIEDISAQIIYTWNGEKKTVRYPNIGTLKFRTTHGLKIDAPGVLLNDMIDHLRTGREIMKYLSGYNKTEVKKYLGIFPQPAEVAELVGKTTVKLEMVK
jgi:hypothetical protein